MVDHWLLKWLLFPVSLLFGLAVALKNALYHSGILTSTRFSLPVISIGNLTVGGSGKTPHTEYLLRILRPYLRVSVLSRGYGRKRTGFMMVQPQMHSADVGDESLIYARKYRDVAVAVSESRSVGIPYLLQHAPYLQVVLLDDAYQHRSVSPSLSILLTEYQEPFYTDWLLPVGRLREWRSGYRRAHFIVVTKCPPQLTEEARREIIDRINPLPQQRVFFSTFSYQDPYPMSPPFARVRLKDYDSVLIVCGIARPEILFEYVSAQVQEVDILAYGDHHDFDRSDVGVLTSRFANLPGDRKMILTTEKDAIRLEVHRAAIHAADLPIYVLPLEVVFLDQGDASFDASIRNFLLNFKS